MKPLDVGSHVLIQLGTYCGYTGVVVRLTRRIAQVHLDRWPGGHQPRIARGRLAVIEEVEG